MNTHYLFIGEQRSHRAIQNGYRWPDRHLSSIQLYLALTAIGLRWEEQVFTNLWYDDGTINRELLLFLPACPLPIVAMGKKVDRELNHLGIPHLRIIHPAARGRIRRASLYTEHVRGVLCAP